MKYIFSSFAAAVLIPLSVYAQTNPNGELSRITNINGVIVRIASIGSVAVYLMIALAVIYIVWATVQYFIKGKSGDESRKESGMQILWGIVGLAIIVSLWGLVNVLVNSFSTNPNVPKERFPNANFVKTNGSSNASFDTEAEARLLGQ